jgi:hypothetical protein
MEEIEVCPTIQKLSRRTEKDYEDFSRDNRFPDRDSNP